MPLILAHLILGAGGSEDNLVYTEFQDSQNYIVIPSWKQTIKNKNKSKTKSYMFGYVIPGSGTFILALQN